MDGSVGHRYGYDRAFRARYSVRIRLIRRKLNMDKNRELNQLEWYISHRLENIEISINMKTEELLSIDATRIDPDMLREVMEDKGRVKELRHLLNWIERWKV